jgi:very-short-patch-repair endonuclease
VVEGAATNSKLMRAPIQTQNRAKILRRSLTAPERTLWAMLRGNQQGFHFRRQHAVGIYILDFYCAAARLCVEIDGPSHDGRADYDARRTSWLNEQGIRVLRFTVDDVEHRSAAILAAIKSAAAPSTTLRVVPLPRKRERSPD